MELHLSVRCGLNPCFCGNCTTNFNDDMITTSSSLPQTQNSNFDFDFDFDCSSTFNFDFPAFTENQNEVASPSGSGFVYSSSDCDVITATLSTDNEAIAINNNNGVFTSDEISLWIAQTSQPAHALISVPTEPEFFPSPPSMEDAFLDAIEEEASSSSSSFGSARHEEEETQNEEEDEEKNQNQNQKTKKRARSFVPSSLPTSKRVKAAPSSFSHVQQQRGPAICSNVGNDIVLPDCVRKQLTTYTEKDFEQLVDYLGSPPVSETVEPWPVAQNDPGYIESLEKGGAWKLNQNDSYKHPPPSKLPKYGPADLNNANETAMYGYSYWNHHPRSPTTLITHADGTTTPPMARLLLVKNKRIIYDKLETFLAKRPDIVEHFFVRQLILYSYDYAANHKAQYESRRLCGVPGLNVFTARYFPWSIGVQLKNQYNNLFKKGYPDFFSPDAMGALWNRKINAQQQ
jgi:hypothetical protein